MLRFNLQNSETTYVKGFKAWNKLGRYVKKGSKGLAILAPFIKNVEVFKEPENKSEYQDKEGEKETRKVLSGFRISYVYDIADTDGSDEMLPVDCEVKLVATGLFYRSVTKYSETVYVGGKIYPYTYPYSYADVSANTLMIDSDSVADSPCRITIYGPCTNPIWKHYVNNELYATGAYLGTLRADHKLVIDTTTVPYSITERPHGEALQ